MVSAAAVSRWFGGDTLTRTGYDTGGVRGFGSTTVFAGKCPPPLCFQTLSAALSLWSSPSVFTLFSVPELVLCVCVCVLTSLAASVLQYSVFKYILEPVQKPQSPARDSSTKHGEKSQSRELNEKLWDGFTMRKHLRFYI